MEYWAEVLLRGILIIGGIALFCFSIIGIIAAVDDYKHNKWTKKYGNRLQQKQDKSIEENWIEYKKMETRCRLFEECLTDENQKKVVSFINKKVESLNWATIHKQACLEAWKNSRKLTG